MNVNEAKSHYATSLLERVRADKIELARLGVDADSAIKMADGVDKLVAEVKQNMASAPAPLGAKLFADRPSRFAKRAYGLWKAAAEHHAAHKDAADKADANP